MSSWPLCDTKQPIRSIKVLNKLLSVTVWFPRVSSDDAGWQSQKLSNPRVTCQSVKLVYSLRSSTIKSIKCYLHVTASVLMTQHCTNNDTYRCWSVCRLPEVQLQSVSTLRSCWLNVCALRFTAVKQQQGPSYLKAQLIASDTCWGPVTNSMSQTSRGPRLG